MASLVATTQRHRRVLLAIVGLSCALGLALAWRSPPAGAASETVAPTGSLIGHVNAPGSDSSSTVHVAGVAVTATAPTGTVYSTTTVADGFYELDQLPAGTYTMAFTPSAGQPQTQTGVTVAAGATETADARLDQPVATITGTVTDHHHRTLAGIPVGLIATPGAPCSPSTICGPTATSGPDGTYTLSVAAGAYELEALDASHVVDVRPITALAGQILIKKVHLAPAAVPAGTAPVNAARDLRSLNAERARAGLPAGVVLNPRWSQECAAHDAYERANGVLSPAENPQAAGASAGGTWAGVVSVLARARWTRAHDPWQSAPIHLLQLLTPSLSVVGLDDSGGLQCATTYPGMLRAPVSEDAVTTYPADGARGVPPREVAREDPFVPGQFVGVPAGRAAGRELFVYLNESGQAGQAQVHVLHASLTRGHQPVAMRWVDNTTRTVGRYLTGAILIPDKPLRPHCAYRATVVVQDRSATLTHSWSFTTGRR